MPSAADHEEKATSNEAFYAELGGHQAIRSDWAITVLFYTAVQEVQALITRKKWKIKTRSGLTVTPRSHEQRDKTMRQYCPELLVEYRALQDWSEAARYDCETFNAGHLKLAEAELRKLRAKIKALG